MSKERYEIDEQTGEILDNHFVLTPEDIVDRLNYLEEQLKNAIVPKFKVGQKVWFIDNERDIQECEIYELKLNRYVRKLVYEISYNIGLEDWTDDVAFEDELFATKEEAQAKLEELKGDKK